MAGSTAGADEGSQGKAPLSAQAREAVRQRIVDRRYPMGARLVEREVAEELRMSRVPVREALRALVAEGLLELLPRSGVRVRRLERTDVRMFRLRDGEWRDIEPSVPEQRGAPVVGFGSSPP
ncbi:GntR family transcriptional regulator, partial [Streptomyces sp. NPDC006422]|uniref:GntR family transcriptional regulator n=1 Tax=Streptomyces sp. NPDC006422 TaxID=3155457 RepID=UPI0033A5F893